MVVVWLGVAHWGGGVILAGEVGQVAARGFRLQPGSEAGSYSRLMDFVYHSFLGLRVKKKKK